MGEISSKATGMGLASAIAAGTATAAPLVVATKQAMTLESAMADVRKVVNFPPRAFAQMSDDILEMSTRIPMSAEGIAQIVAAAGRAPCRARNCWALPRMPPRWASPSTAPPKRPGRPWPSGAPPSSCPSPGWSLADQINALTNSFGGDVGAVTDMVTRIGPLGKVGGLAASQIAAMSQVLSSVGVDPKWAPRASSHDARAHQGRGGDRSQRDAFKSLGSMPGRSPRTCSATRAARSPM
jgi:hypothetical protein